MDLHGKCALVTGGGSGMGASVARMLGARGARVAVLDLNGDAAEATAKEIAGLAFSADVADESSVKGALEETISQIGIPHVVVSCAGVAPGRAARRGADAGGLGRGVLDPGAAAGRGRRPDAGGS